MTRTSSTLYTKKWTRGRLKGNSLAKLFFQEQAKSRLRQLSQEEVK